MKIKENSNDATFHNNEGRRLLNLKKYEESISCYNRAIELNPNNAFYHNNKGESLYNLKKYDESIFCCDKTIELNQNNAYYHNNKGVSLNNLKKYDESISCYNKAIELNPNNPCYHNNKAESLYDLKKYDESIFCCDKAIELNPNNADYHNNKANCLLEINKFESAIKSYFLALSNNKNSSDIHYKMSICFFRLFRYEEALESIFKALEIDPENTKYKNQKEEIILNLTANQHNFDNFMNSNLKNFYSYVMRIDTLCHFRKYNEAMKLIIDSLDLINERQINTLKKYLKLIHQSEIFSKYNSNPPQKEFLGCKRSATEEIFYKESKKARNELFDIDEFKNQYTELISKDKELKHELSLLDQKVKKKEMNIFNTKTRLIMNFIWKILGRIIYVI